MLNCCLIPKSDICGGSKIYRNNPSWGIEVCSYMKKQNKRTYMHTHNYPGGAVVGDLLVGDFVGKVGALDGASDGADVVGAADGPCVWLNCDSGVVLIPPEMKIASNTAANRTMWKTDTRMD